MWLYSVWICLRVFLNVCVSTQGHALYSSRFSASLITFPCFISSPRKKKQVSDDKDDKMCYTLPRNSESDRYVFLKASRTICVKTKISVPFNLRQFSHSLSRTDFTMKILTEPFDIFPLFNMKQSCNGQYFLNSYLKFTTTVKLLDWQ